VLQLWLFFLTNRYAELQQRLPEVEHAWQFQTQEAAATPRLFSHQEVQALMMALQAEMAIFQGEVRRGARLSQQVLALLDRDFMGLRSIISHSFGRYHWLHDEVMQTNTQLATSERGSSTKEEQATLTQLSQLAELKEMQGNFRQAIALFRRMLQVAAEGEQPGRWLMTALAHSELGIWLYEANELAEAEIHARQAIKLGEEGIGILPLMLGYLALAQIAIVQENFGEAEAAIERMARLAQRTETSLWSILAARLRMQLALAQVDLAAVAFWRQASGMSENDELDEINVMIYRGFAHILVVLGEMAAATTLLERLLAYFEASQWVDGIIRILAIQAIALYSQGQLDAALATLERALSLAEPALYVRTFVDLGAPMAALLRQAHAGEIAPSYVSKLLVAFEPKQVVPDKRQAPTELPTELPALSSQSSEPRALKAQKLVEALTPRELEILHLMAAGQSNREMARTLVVTVGTVKRHLSNIFGKLATTNRTQTVARARELELL
jgi:LuxR family maltose regulon positive regulatory protein